jgi:NADPH2:quinone reductase
MLDCSGRSRRSVRAIVFDRAGVPEDVLHLSDIASPPLAPGEALVSVAVRPINPADLAFIGGQYRIRPAFPQAAGLEGMGIVLDAGSNAGVQRGSRVAFRWPGSWAEVVSVPVSRLIDVPADIPDVSAAQMSLNPITAWALLDSAGVCKGDWIVLTAAMSGVSNLVGILARQRGVRVIGVVRGDAKEGASRCTADGVFSSDDPGLVDAIIAATGNLRAAALIDSVGGPLAAQLFGILAPGARVIAYGVQDRAAAQITNAMLIYSNLTWQGFGIDRWLTQQSAVRMMEIYDDLWPMVRKGTLKLPVASTHSLEAFGDALSANALPSRDGKVLLV